MTCDTKYKNAVTVESARTNIPDNSRVVNSEHYFYVIPNPKGEGYVLTNPEDLKVVLEDCDMVCDDHEISKPKTLSAPRFVASLPVKKRVRDPLDVMKDLIASSRGSQPKSCRPASRTRRKRNKAFDLVGIESNPGPRRGSRVVERVVVKTQPSKKKGKKKMGKSQSSVPNRSTQFTAAPASFGMIAPQSYFRQSSNAQRNTEQDPRGSVRVSGCALLRQSAALLTGTSPVASQSYGILGAAPSSAPYRGYYHLNPNNIDARLTAVANAFQFYAFRRIKANYISSLPTAARGAVHMAIVKDPDTAVANYATIGAPAGNSPGTNSTLMDYDPSVTSTIWQPCSVTYTHTGTRLWDTFQAGSDDIDDRIQASLIMLASNIDPTGAGTGIPPASATVNMGWLWLEYDIDFYIPGPPTN